MKKAYTSIFLLLIAAASAIGQQTSVLFLGNSYTSSSLPTAFYNLALAGGDTIYRESNTPGGHTLNGHSTNATSLSKIASRNWDFVVMQEQSQLPSFPDGQVANEVYPYAAILVDSIRSNYECTEPVFYMTWGRRDGDQSNCANFPPICTYEGMQERLRNAYLQMTFDNDATVAPCGAAWQQMALTNNSFFTGLYTGDGSHPSAWGVYLNACVFYATILRKSPVGLDYYSSIGETDGVVLQQLAEDIVLDSLITWNIGHQDPTANGEVSYNGTSFEFTNSSINAEYHFWDFGDGMTSESANPTHDYINVAVYDVMYVASSNCTSDTTYISVDVGSSVSIEDSELFKGLSLIQNESGSTLQNLSNESFDLQVLDATGRLITRTKLNANSTLIMSNVLETGFNILRLDKKGVSKTYKVVKR
jgi:hypothetical protein